MPVSWRARGLLFDPAACVNQASILLVIGGIDIVERARAQQESRQNDTHSCQNSISFKIDSDVIMYWVVVRMHVYDVTQLHGIL